ncbi:MAG: VapC toxin family PIN domain ribonuclease [Acidobacteriota bacterium]|nr:VapC toxin family PIN domain ribonuclease [Acidobacteriota bacterium]
MIALLDVSILVALFDPGHVHHEIAHDWFDEQRREGWATCPLTENGFVRLATSLVYASPPHRPVEIVQRLATLRRSGRHHFWPDSLSLADERVFAPSLVRGHKQITDVYLLGLAAANHGTLATFDRSISIGAVKGATRSTLQVITAVPEGSRSEDR